MKEITLSGSYGVINFRFYSEDVGIRHFIPEDELMVFSTIEIYPTGIMKDDSVIIFDAILELNDIGGIAMEDKMMQGIEIVEAVLQKLYVLDLSTVDYSR